MIVSITIIIMTIIRLILILIHGIIAYNNIAIAVRIVTITITDAICNVTLVISCPVISIHAVVAIVIIIIIFLTISWTTMIIIVPSTTTIIMTIIIIRIMMHVRVIYSTVMIVVQIVTITIAVAIGGAILGHSSPYVCLYHVLQIWSIHIACTERCQHLPHLLLHTSSSFVCLGVATFQEKVLLGVRCIT